MFIYELKVLYLAKFTKCVSSQSVTSPEMRKINPFFLLFAPLFSKCVVKSRSELNFFLCNHLTFYLSNKTKCSLTSREQNFLHMTLSRIQGHISGSLLNDANSESHTYLGLLNNNSQIPVQFREMTPCKVTRSSTGLWDDPLPNQHSTGCQNKLLARAVISIGVSSVRQNWHLLYLCCWASVAMREW